MHAVLALGHAHTLVHLRFDIEITDIEMPNSQSN